MKSPITLFSAELLCGSISVTIGKPTKELRKLPHFIIAIKNSTKIPSVKVEKYCTNRMIPLEDYELKLYANGNGVHINGIESFWSFTKRRLAKFNGVKSTFELHLKECEWRWRQTNMEMQKELWKLLLDLKKEKQ